MDGKIPHATKKFRRNSLSKKQVGEQRPIDDQKNSLTLRLRDLVEFTYGLVIWQS